MRTRRVVVRAVLGRLAAGRSRIEELEVLLALGLRAAANENNFFAMGSPFICTTRTRRARNGSSRGRARILVLTDVVAHAGDVSSPPAVVVLARCNASAINRVATSRIGAVLPPAAATRLACWSASVVASVGTIAFLLVLPRLVERFEAFFALHNSALIFKLSHPTPRECTRGAKARGETSN